MRAKNANFARNEKNKNKKCGDNGENPARSAKIAKWKRYTKRANPAKEHILHTAGRKKTPQ